MFHQTNTLTTGIDAVTGTAGDDTISGARVDSVQTLNSGDKIDGGAGNDTLTVVLSTAGAATLTPAAGAIVNVENIVVTAVGTGDQTIQFAEADGTKVGISGVTSITNLASTEDLLFTNLTSIPAITLNNTVAETTVSFAKGALSGTADTVTLNVSGNGNAVTLTPTTGEDIENLVVNSTKAASTVTAAGVRGDTLKTVQVTGDANISFGATASFDKATSFDGSTATGGITASFDTFGSGTANAQTISTGAGKDVITLGQDGGQYASIKVNTGAGDDKVVVGTLLSSKHSIDGGAGKNTLSVDLNAATPTLAQVSLVNSNVSNFQVMELTTTGGTTNVTALNLGIFTGFNDYVFTHGNSVTTALTGVTSGKSVTFNGNLVGAAGTLSTAAATSALSLEATGTKQTASIVADAASSPLLITGGQGGNSGTTAIGVKGSAAITFGTGVETLNISADKGITITGGASGGTTAGSDTSIGGAAGEAIANGTAVKTVVVSGKGDVSVLGGAKTTGDKSGAASIDAFTGAVTVNASTLTGKLTIAGSADADTITVGSGGSEVRSTLGGDTITLGAGADVVKYSDGTHSGAGDVTLSAFTLAIDTIKSFGANDKFDVSAIGTASALTVLTGSQKALIEAEFASSGGLKAAMNAVDATIGENKAVQIQLGGDTFLFVSNNTGGLDAGDLLVKIEGLVTLTADNLVF